MSRRISTDAFQMELRSSPSQQHLDPSRSSSLTSQRNDDFEPALLAAKERRKKLDYYSIPVFLVELALLAGLGYLAYYIHFESFEPYKYGFYCDDISYRQQLHDQYRLKVNENQLLLALLPLATFSIFIVFCELVNSTFGTLKFHKVRACCNCLQLHSFTRRTIRFIGAYIFGFLIVVISCNILALRAGQMRPYFAEECPLAYRQCVARAEYQPTGPPQTQAPSTSAPPATLKDPVAPPSPPISSLSPLSSNVTHRLFRRQSSASSPDRLSSGLKSIVERQWVDLDSESLAELCQSEPGRQLNQLVMSWPSIEAAVLSYALLFVAGYLWFVGTARPVRMVSCIIIAALVACIILCNSILVNCHYNHWSDVIAGSFIALLTVVLVIKVYLNTFKDSHYYKDRKVSSNHFHDDELNLKGFSNEAIMNSHSFIKTEPPVMSNGSMLQNGATNNNSISNNDLAMRYFQIPRANFRNAPRPMSSSINQIR